MLSHTFIRVEMDFLDKLLNSIEKAPPKSAAQIQAEKGVFIHCCERNGVFIDDALRVGERCEAVER